MRYVINYKFELKDKQLILNALYPTKYDLTIGKVQLFFVILSLNHTKKLKQNFFKFFNYNNNYLIQ